MFACQLVGGLVLARLNYFTVVKSPLYKPIRKGYLLMTSIIGYSGNNKTTVTVKGLVIGKG